MSRSFVDAFFFTRRFLVARSAGFDARKTGISVGRACFFARAELSSRHYAAAAGFALADGRARADHLARSFHFDPLYVEDPLNPGNNVGRNCFRIAQIQRSWSDAFYALSDAVAKGSRPAYKAGDARRPSLLSAIVGLSEELGATSSSISSQT